MNINLKSWLSSLLMGAVFPLFAQEANTKQLGLTDLFDLADAHNQDLKILDQVQHLASLNIKEEKQKLLPTIDANVAFSYNADGWISDRNFSNGFSVEIPAFGANFALEAKQIIYAGGAIRNSIELAKLGQQSSLVEKELVKQNVRFGITGYYLEMQKISNQRIVIEKNITQTEKMIAQIKAKKEQGVALKNNITRYELQLQSLHVALLQLNNAIDLINNELVQLVNLPIGTKIKLKPLEGLATAADGALGNNTKDWMATALETSPEVHLAGLDIQKAEKVEKLVKADRLPQVYGFASEYLNGPILIEIPTINKNFNYWYVGAGVKYSISSLYKNKVKEDKAKTASKIAYEKEAKIQDQLVKDIQAAQIKYLETIHVYKNRLKSVELAKQNYNVVQNRYLNQLSLITEMMDAENTQLDAELQATNAQINILFHYYQLRKLAGTL